MNSIKVGDLVEDCSLMPGVVMRIEGDDIEIRRLDLNYRAGQFSHCSLGHCGIIQITPQGVINRLRLGKDKLAEIWGSWEGKHSIEYEKLIEQAIQAL